MRFRSRIGASESARSGRSASKEESSALLRNSCSSESTVSAGESSSSQSFDEASVASTKPLCATAPESVALSQRLVVHMSHQVWQVRHRRGDPIASLQSPPNRDEMIVHDGNGKECGVIIPTSSSTTRGCHEYTLYSFEPCFENQKPTITGEPESGIPSFYLCARIGAEPDQGPGKGAGCHRFLCRTRDGRHFAADNILWTTFQSRAFCIRETTKVKGCTGISAARVTCLTEKDRELIVYHRVDPILMLAFVAVMEEVVLVTNL